MGGQVWLKMNRFHAAQSVSESLSVHTANVINSGISDENSCLCVSGSLLWWLEHHLGFVLDSFDCRFSRLIPLGNTGEDTGAAEGFISCLVWEWFRLLQKKLWSGAGNNVSSEGADARKQVALRWAIPRKVRGKKIERDHLCILARYTDWLTFSFNHWVNNVCARRFVFLINM